MIKNHSGVDGYQNIVWLRVMRIMKLDESVMRLLISRSLGYKIRDGSVAVAVKWRIGSDCHG